MDLDLWSGDFASGSLSGSGDNASLAYNDTDTCAERSIDNTMLAFPYPIPLAISVRVIFLIYCTVLMVLSTLLNLLVIVLVGHHKRLQTTSFLLGLQVTVLDLACSILLAFRIITAIASGWVFGNHVCVITGYLHYLMEFTRVELMMVLVADRFFTVFTPFFYERHQVKVAQGMSVVSYVFPLLLSTVPLFLDCFSFQASDGRCSFNSGCSTHCAIVKKVVGFVLITPSCILQLALYSALFWKAKKLRSQVAVVPDNNNKTDTLRREWRATATFFLMFLVLFLLTVPPRGLIYIGHIIYPNISTKPMWYKLVELVVSNLAQLVLIMDPIVIMRNSDVKEVMAKVKWLPKLCC